MRDSRSVLADLLATGLTVEQQLLVTELAMSAASERASTSNESSEQRRKRVKSENNQRAYEARLAKEQRLTAPEKDLNAPESQAPEMRLTAPDSGGVQAPLACVGDNKLTTKEPCLSVSSLLCAKADLDPRDLRELERVLRDEGSPALNQTAPKLCIVAPILALLNGEAGPACDLHMDVLPVIRSKSKAVRPNSITGWEFYRPAILEARDKRLQTNPDVIPIAEHRRSRQSQEEDAYREVRQRMLEAE